MVEIILEIIKYLLPALVVYLLMRQFINGQRITEQLKLVSNTKKETLALRLQAYERLILFCERINIDSLIMRLNTDELSASDLKNAMLISIEKEFEHNLTQQIYVSANLWEMVDFLKENTISIISQSYLSKVKEGKDELIRDFYLKGKQLEGTMTAKVKEGIRKELELYLN